MTKEKLISFLVSLGTKQELSLLIAKQLNGEDYPLEEQIRDRYYLYEPLIFHEEETLEDQRQVVRQYKELLDEENKESIRNLFLDQLENRVFFSSLMHKESLKMISNLTKGNYEPIKEIEGAVKEIVKRIDKKIYPILSLEIDGKTYELKDQLRARGSNNWLGSSRGAFVRIIEYEAYPWFCKAKNIKDKVTLFFFIASLESCFLEEERQNRKTKILKPLKQTTNGRIWEPDFSFKKIIVFLLVLILLACGIYWLSNFIKGTSTENLTYSLLL